MPRSLPITVLALVVAGCDTSSRSLDLDEPLAKQSLSAALDAWKAGRQPADLKPDLIVGDWDWKAGKTLVAYEVLPDERSDGTNLHIPVRLTLKDQKGRQSRADALYVVGTSPQITVFRQDL